MTVTAFAASGSDTRSRNTVLEEALEADIERAISSPHRAWAERLCGPSTDEEVGARTAKRFAEKSSYWCCRCKHVFVDGEVVYRRRSGRFESTTWKLEAYCEECVSGWHPTWLAQRKAPAPCDGGCGVLVSHWYWGTISTCSTSCTKRAAAERRRAKHDLRSCEGCGNAFTPERADARYCSNACRQKAYRERRATSPDRPAESGAA